MLNVEQARRASVIISFVWDMNGWCEQAVALGSLKSTGALTQHKAQHYLFGLIISSAGTFMQLYTHISTIYKQRISLHLQKAFDQCLHVPIRPC